MPEYNVDIICANIPQDWIQPPYQPLSQPQYRVSYQQAEQPVQYAVEWPGQHAATMQAAVEEEAEEVEEEDDDDDEEEEEGEEEEEEEDDEYDEYDEEAEEEEEYKKVHLTLKKRIFHDNEYLFVDARNTVRLTKKEEWTRVTMSNGQTGWVYQSGRTRYITYKMPR